MERESEPSCSSCQSIREFPWFERSSNRSSQCHPFTTSRKRTESDLNRGEEIHRPAGGSGDANILTLSGEQPKKMRIEDQETEIYERKRRTTFTDHQVAFMESIFQKDKYITVGYRKQIARELYLSQDHVRIWFQNRRAKARKDEESEAKTSDGEEKEDEAQNNKRPLHALEQSNYSVRPEYTVRAPINPIPPQPSSSYPWSFHHHHDTATGSTAASNIPPPPPAPIPSNVPSLPPHHTVPGPSTSTFQTFHALPPHPPRPTHPNHPPPSAHPLSLPPPPPQPPHSVNSFYPNYQFHNQYHDQRYSRH